MNSPINNTVANGLNMDADKYSREYQIRLTGGMALVTIAKNFGVTQAFGLSSGKLSPVFKALSETPEIGYVGVRHEAAASFMATAIAARTGAVALCLGETGPGGVNLLSGLAGAFANNLPVLAVTSSNPSIMTAPDLGAFASSDNLGLFSHLTKWNARVTDIRRVPSLVRQALQTAVSGRPGPVHLDIPADILSQTHLFDRQELQAPLPLPSPRADAATLDEAARRLQAAERPLVIAGGGLVRAQGADALRALIDRTDWPVTTTQMGMGLIASDDPRLIGQGGVIGGPAVLRALREADVVLALGCRFSSWLWTDPPYGWKASPEQQLIHVDLDPGVIGKVRPATLGVVGDARIFVETLIERLEPTHAPRPWTQDLSDERDRHRAKLNQLAARPATSAGLHPAALAQRIGQAVGDQDLVVFDGGHTSFWSNDFTPALTPRTRFHEPGMTHLGFGLPWAIALKRAEPARAVWCLTGDGAMGFTIQELDTARREGLPIVVVVHNNAAFGVIGFAQSRGGFSFGADLADTDYAAIARGFGCFGERVTTLEAFDEALSRALASGLPAVLDVRVIFDPHPQMPAFGKSTAGTSH